VAALTSNQRRFLADLPTSRMFTIAGKKFLLVHATPRDPMDEYATPDPAFWAPRIAGLHVDYILAGHTHQPYTLQVNGTKIVNPGSIGLNRDGDPRAAYAIIEDDTVELKRIDYPIGETIAAIEDMVTEPTARQMLVDIYNGGSYLAKWRANGMWPMVNGHNGNGTANGNGTTNGSGH
jgi:diadenosine tetraphosphatase ApaH/serine/threonine PP2A family protein phosphatase